MSHARNPLDLYADQRGPELNDDAEIDMARLDLNDDGRDEVFLTKAADVSDRSSSVWHVYESHGEGYRPAGMLSFERDGHYFGPLKGQSGNVLVSYYTPSSGERELDVRDIVDGRLDTLFPRELDEEENPQYVQEVMDLLNERNIPIVTGTLAELREQLAADVKEGAQSPAQN